MDEASRLARYRITVKGLISCLSPLAVTQLPAEALWWSRPPVTAPAPVMTRDHGDV